MAFRENSKVSISLDRETCFLTAHMTVNPLNLECKSQLGVHSFCPKDNLQGEI